MAKARASSFSARDHATTEIDGADGVMGGGSRAVMSLAQALSSRRPSTTALPAAISPPLSARAQSARYAQKPPVAIGGVAGGRASAGSTSLAQALTQASNGRGGGVGGHTGTGNEQVALSRKFQQEFAKALFADGSWLSDGAETGGAGVVEGVGVAKSAGFHRLGPPLVPMGGGGPGTARSVSFIASATSHSNKPTYASLHNDALAVSDDVDGEDAQPQDSPTTTPSRGRYG